MQIRAYALLAAFWVCCAMHVYVIAQPVYSPSDYRFQHYDMSDGLASESAKEIVQDSLGFLWILHDNGLSRYDGYNFKFYKHDPNDQLGPGPPLNGFMELDKSGNLWFLSNQGIQPDFQLILTRYDRKKDGFIKYYPDLKGALVHCTAIDKNGTTVWMGTRGRGLYSFDTATGETKFYLNKHPDSVINLKRNSFMEQRNAIFGMSDRDSILLLATWRGLWQFNKATKEFSHPKCHPADTSMLYNSPILSILEWPKYNKDLCFVIYNKGLIKVNLDISEKSSSLFAGLNNLRDRSFLRDKFGVFWLTDINDGLFRYDPQDSSLVNLKINLSDPYALRSSRLTGFTIDRDQNLWIATQDRGISKLPNQSMRFYNYDFKGQVTANTVYKANKKNYLVVSQSKSTQEGDDEILFAMIAQSNLKTLDFKKISLKKPIEGKVTQIAMGKNHLWIGTGGYLNDGVIGLPINTSSGLIESGPARAFTHDPENPNTISGNIQIVGNINISGIWEDQEQNLWLGSGSMGGGLNKVRLNIPYGKEGSVVRYNHILNDSTSLSSGVIWWEMYPENKNSFWVITASGLDLFRNGSFEHYFKNDYVMTVKRDSKGTLLVGTTSGLYESTDKENFRFKKNPSKILSESGVYAFQEDKLGRLWISNHGSIKCYDRQRNTVIQFDEAEGIDFARDWVEQTSDGVFMSADVQGVSLFDPLSFKVDETISIPVITRLTVNNETPPIQNANSDARGFSIKNDISVLDKLVLDYQHNHFALEFSAMEMTAPERNIYRHKLEGYDGEWIETDYKNRSATYTNLPAGDYTFKVKASNSHGIWSDQETTLSVVILPPPWKTWWAYTGYLMLVAGALVVARKNIVQRERLKANLKLEQVEREKEHIELEKAQEVDRVKTSFFTNISHEFRTPLTLIKGPVQNIIEQFVSGQKEIDKQKVVDQLKLVERNSDLLLRLINQLLDLAKLESGSLKVEKSEGDLFSFIRAIASSFESFARQKNVSIEINVPAVPCATLFDKDKLETILINLINNAIKFTPVGGKVIVKAVVHLTPALSGGEGDARLQGIPKMSITTPQTGVTPSFLERGQGGEVNILKLTITDTGIGIPEEHQNKIFERFHQVSEAHKEVGTGIGLSLVKELAALMEGSISVKSEVGNGSEFIVVLPVEIISRQITVSSDSQGVKTTLSRQTPQATESSQPDARNSEDDGQAKPHVLVVEDNNDLRAFIIDSLGNEFYFLEAENGKIGLEVATREVPDLIISDVMMPEMDGITMATKIKKDIHTSHIPLILLTAKSTEDSKLSGLQSGADDYLTKPFNKNELLLKVRNGVNRQQKLREKLRAELMSTAPKVEVLSEDEQFLNSVKEKILERLSDEQLSVESLAEDMGMSRVQLYRKISGLTDISVNELIRKLRLQRAAQLISQNWGPVSLVAYEVGFSNLSYFSKVFKEEFGVLPSEYGVKT